MKGYLLWYGIRVLCTILRYAGNSHTDGTCGRVHGSFINLWLIPQINFMIPIKYVEEY